MILMDLSSPLLSKKGSKSHKRKSNSLFISFFKKQLKILCSNISNNIKKFREMRNKTQGDGRPKDRVKEEHIHNC